MNFKSNNKNDYQVDIVIFTKLGILILQFTIKHRKINGSTLYSNKVDKNNNIVEFSISTNDLQSGIYFLEILQNKKDKLIEKVIVE